MEGLACSQEMAQIDSLFKTTYDLNSSLVFFPVRHHSPACSFHLLKVIEQYRPDIILIEGPSDTDNLIRYMVNEESEAPFCIYYSYSDSKGILGEKDGKYMCYYPFLDYSPELVAIREAKARGIPARFIDLTYSEILMNSRLGETVSGKTPKASYNDDYLLQRSTFITQLCQKEGCRNFHELWEKLYEIDALYQDTAVFVRNMLAFCYLSRMDYSKEMLEDEGCIAREEFMVQNIREAAAANAKVLVVTGGFHTWGLAELMKNGSGTSRKNIEPGNSGVYAMAYSFEESDQLNGYASGMPHPAFYQKVWDGIGSKEENPYDSAVLHFIVRCGGRIRKKDGALSTADEIEAFNMAKGLKVLREKSGCGVLELNDCVRACFVKGELNAFEHMPLEILGKLLTGKKTGKLCGEAEVPPIVKDFREMLLQLRLKTGTTVEQEVVLDIYKNKKHRETSKFLHTMSYLETDFCKKIKGPDFINRKDTNLIRETWKYRWRVSVESSLIEISVYGGTLKEAATGILENKFKDIGEHAGEASLLMMEAFMMGLDEQLAQLAGSASEIISKDGIFYSLAQCTYNLYFLSRASKTLGSLNKPHLDSLVKEAYNKAVILVPGLGNTSEDEENPVIARLKDLYQITLQNGNQAADNGTFAESLFSLLASNGSSSAIEGAAVGLLLGFCKVDRSFAVKKAEGYLYGTGEKFIKSAGFLKGLFSTARDVIFHEAGFVKDINNVIWNMPQEDFMKILPDLRLAFSFFTPGEIDDIAKLPMLKTSLVIFDTEVVDLSGCVDDPVETLMSVQLGGGTNIAKALQYCYGLIENPLRTMVVVVTDLCEGGPYESMYARAKSIIESGAKLIVLTSLDMQSTPVYDRKAAEKMAAIGAEVAALTPEGLAKWIAGIIS